MEKTPRVSVVIINLDGLEDTAECLESLVLSQCVELDIIIVDNGSKTDQYEQLRDRFCHIARIVRSETNLGFTGGNNLGFDYLPESLDFVALLNNDTVVANDTLTKLCLAMERENFAIAGPVVLNYDRGKDGMNRQSAIQSAGGSVNLWTGSTHMHRWILPGKATLQKDMVCGCCFVIRKDVFEEFGGFDDAYFAYYEETDLCARAKRKGYKVGVTTDAIMWHKGESTSRRFSGFHETQMMRNRFLFVKKNGSKAQFFAAIVYVTFVYLALHGANLLASGQGNMVPYLLRGYFRAMREIVFGR